MISEGIPGLFQPGRQAAIAVIAAGALVAGLTAAGEPAAGKPQLGGKGYLGWFAGAAAAVRELPGSSGRCHHACQMMQRRGADAAVRSWPAARLRLTVIVVSAGQGLLAAAQADRD